MILPALALATLAGSCSSAKKKTTPELSRLEGKKVALVDVEAEPTARTIVEVALVNQLIQRGSFQLLSKQDVDTAKAAPGVDTSDWKAVAKKAGADVALRAKVREFDAQTHEGYDKEMAEDSQMIEERGEEGRRTEKLIKVHSIRAKVRVELQFLTLDDNDLRTGVADAETEEVRKDSRQGAARLPPKMSVLQKLTEGAFKKFFERYE